MGYKNQVKTDSESKLITNYMVTDASVHDSNWRLPLLDNEDRVLYADSSYSSKDLAASIPTRRLKRIQEKGVRGKPLTKRQKYNNRRRAKVRTRVKHIFGFMTNTTPVLPCDVLE